MSPRAVAKPFLCQLVKICIVTGNLKNTLDDLLELGIGPFKIYHFASSNVIEQTFRGQPASFEPKMAFAESGKMVWEVMQPVRAPTSMQKFVDRTGGVEGVRHVASDCEDERPDYEESTVGEEKREGTKRRRKEFEARGKR